MSDLVGRNLGAYRIVEQLGVGGMATVFKAYQPAMDRYVAIKVLPQHLANDPSFRARFDREARIIARLEHRHILPVYDVGDADGVPFLVMRFTESGTLSDMIAAGPLDPARAVELVAQIGEALSYAHSQGVIHRDIKPANVLISREGDALLSDFGIAKIYEDSMHLTGEGVMVGTPYYMAPEQVQGRPADPRTDIYSLGVILYEAVTGRRPFEAETPLAVALKHMHDPLPLPRTIRPMLHEALERLILRAMAKSADDRFQSADAMVSALRSLPAEVLSVAAVPVPPTVMLPAAPAVAAPPSPAAAAPQPPPAVAPAPLPQPPTSPPRPAWFMPVVAGSLALSLVLILVVVFWRSPGRMPSDQEAVLPTGTAAQPGQASGSLADGPTIAPLPDVEIFADQAYTNEFAQLGGFIWAATEGGLARYAADGSAVVYTVADGLPFNAITAISAAPDGTLWIGGYDRIAQVTPVAGGIGAVQFYGYDEGVRVGRVTDFFFIEDSGMLVSGSGGENPLVTRENDRWRVPADIPFDDAALAGLSLEVYDVTRDEQGAIWLAIYGSTLRWDGRAWAVLPVGR
ncbi:MAG TPA: protein kinase, partial [Roseiflexaceae bacterium]|nr:protein kinase [Roseiflexaceae bacterium]